MSDASRGRILSVEDDSTQRLIYEKALGLEGYEVVSAEGGEEAVAALEQQTFDVVLSDIRLPGMDGMQLLGEIRARDEDVPVILVTGDPSLDTAVRAVEFGAMRYLTKPVDLDELAAVVDQATKLRRLARIRKEALAVVGGSQIGVGDRAALEARLDRALATLQLHFQPIVHCSTRESVGWEALMRTTESELKSPPAVLEAAQQLDRLPDVGRRVRSLAAQAARDLPDHRRLFVNLHPIDLADDELYERTSPLSRWADRVVLEITERARIDDIGTLGNRIRDLRSLGYRIAVDDFGAGYSGLNTFAQLTPDIAKIDMDLVRDVDREPTKARLIRSIVELCSDMSIELIAEGVETEAERAAVTELGCPLIQGYLFGRPGPTLAEANV